MMMPVNDQLVHMALYLWSFNKGSSMFDVQVAETFLFLIAKMEDCKDLIRNFSFTVAILTFIIVILLFIGLGAAWKYLRRPRSQPTSLQPPPGYTERQVRSLENFIFVKEKKEQMCIWLLETSNSMNFFGSGGTSIEQTRKPTNKR